MRIFLHVQNNIKPKCRKNVSWEVAYFPVPDRGFWKGWKNENPERQLKQCSKAKYYIESCKLKQKKTKQEKVS